MTGGGPAPESGSPPRPRVVVLRHHERVPLGVLEPPLAERVNLCELAGYLPGGVRDAVDEFISGGAYDAVVALGGPMGVYERSEHPFLEDSLRLLGDALRRGRPVLGLCLGSQLLAEAAGAEVFPGGAQGLAAEVGFFPLHVTDAGRRDPVVDIYAGGPPVLFWHQDTHPLPEGATLLAGTELYPVAAYRLGSRAYGIQFHLEVGPRVLEKWVTVSPLPARAGVDPARVLEEARDRRGEIEERAAALAALFAAWAQASLQERMSSARETASSGEEA